MQSKNLLQYREFTNGNGNYPSIKDSFSKGPYYGQDKIVEYLRKGHVTLCSPTITVDVFTGQRIDNQKYLMTDGEYSWNNALAYYVEKYHLRLPLEFEAKVLSV